MMRVSAKYAGGLLCTGSVRTWLHIGNRSTILPTLWATGTLVRLLRSARRETYLKTMEIFQVNDDATLFLSPNIDDWGPVECLEISVVIDMDGDLDIGVPVVPNHMLYIYFPIFDEDLPDLSKLHELARLGANLVKTGHKVLAHCGLGFNRSALMTGLILVYLGMSGKDAIELLRQRRPGALFNDNFAHYLESMTPELLPKL